MRPDAEIRLPAETAYVAVLRMAAAGIAARLDFTLDDIEDLKMAITEASALVLDAAAPEANLQTAFYMRDTTLTVEVSAEAADAVGPDPESFTWQVLNSTATDVTATAADGRLQIALSVASSSISTLS